MPTDDLPPLSSPGAAKSEGRAEELVPLVLPAVWPFWWLPCVPRPDISPAACPSRIAVPSARSHRRCCICASSTVSFDRSRRLANSVARTAVSFAAPMPADASAAPSAGACAVTSDGAQHLIRERECVGDFQLGALGVGCFKGADAGLPRRHFGG